MPSILPGITAFCYRFFRRVANFEVAKTCSILGWSIVIQKKRNKIDNTSRKESVYILYIFFVIFCIEREKKIMTCWKEFISYPNRVFIVFGIRIIWTNRSVWFGLWHMYLLFTLIEIATIGPSLLSRGVGGSLLSGFAHNCESYRLLYWRVAPFGTLQSVRQIVNNETYPCV